MRLSPLRSIALAALSGTMACSALLDTDALKTEGQGDAGRRDRGVSDGRARDRGVTPDSSVRVDVGVVPQAALSLTAASGAVLTQMNVTGPAPGTSTAIVFTLRNTGTAATAGVPLPSLTNLTNFEVSANACGAALAPNASCTFSVRPKATANGSYNATLRVSSGTVSSNSLSLAGAASGFLVPPVLELTAGSGAVLTAMNVTAPGPGTPITFTVRNTGATAMSAAVTITLSTTTNFEIPAANNNCTAALAAGATCTFQVRPKATADGPYEASLTVAVGASASNGLTLSGTASGFAPALTLTPSADQTGMNVTPAANPGAAVTFTVTNTGGTPTTVLPTVVLSTTTNFEVATGSTCTAVLDPAASCTFSVRPKATADGALSGTVRVTAGTNVVSATVNLRGTASGFAPALSLTPSAAQTGMDVQSGTPPAVVTFTVTNTGGTPTTVLPTVVLGNPGNFALVANLCTGVLDAGEACTFGVRPTATVDGDFSGNVQVTAGEGVASATVDLSGTASGF